MRLCFSEPRPLPAARAAALALAVCAPLAGCSGVAKGVAEAVIESQKSGDNRQCEIEGGEFKGVRESLEAQASYPGKITKILMVHGVSDHLPGYSRRFQKGLFAELGLNVADAETKTINLDSDAVTWKKGEPHVLGTLRVTRHSDTEGKRILQFYELTWSPITEQQKNALKADSANNEGLKRADVNGYLKTFMNETVPDMLIYNGTGYEKIIASVGESICFMLGDRWEDLPSEGTRRCMGRPRADFAASAKRDDHFFVTHSLGSRITLDALQEIITGKYSENREDPQSAALRTGKEGGPKMFRDADFTVFMLANQLPLLQTGREPAARTDAETSDCALSGSRLAKGMHVVAFSDPNDILSYPVPPSFLRQTLPPGLCPGLDNVSLNLAPERKLFDAASFANPLDAHSGYMEDPRVIALIADGLRRPVRTPLIRDKCVWLETRAHPKATRAE